MAYGRGGGGANVDEGSVTDAVDRERNESTANGQDTNYPSDQVGAYGHAPADLTGLFPNAMFANFNPVEWGKWAKSKLAPFQYTDPMAFGAKYGDFMRKEMSKNFDFAQELGLKELDTELAGLKHFAPAAAALKRNETAIDNLFNQYMRTSQLDSTMPGMRTSLADQTKRAETYASGRLLDSEMDSAMALNTRSAAADQAAAGGFGATSSVARKASDLMSAEQRLQIGMMGENLLGTNAQLRTAIEMAPTEYSNAGMEMRVMPEVGAGRLTAAAFSETNALSAIPAATALSSEIQQREFRTQQMQQNRQFNKANRIQNAQFNAANEFQESMFNAGQANQFSLAKFGYQVAQAGAVAGAAQTNTNTETGITQQNQALEAYSSALASGQGAAGISGILGGAGSFIGGIASAADTISGMFKAGPVSTAPSGGGGGGGSEGGGGTRSISLDPNSDVGQAVQASSQPSSAGVPQMATFTRSASIPSDYMQLNTAGSAMGGPVSAVPRETVAANMGSFSSDMGIRIDPTGKQQAQISQALLSAGSVLNSAGVSYEAIPGQRPIGINLAGDKMFSDATLMSSPNRSAGQAISAGASSLLGSYGVMTDADYAAAGQIGRASSSDRLGNRLDTLAAAQDGKGFVGAALGSLGIGTAKENMPAAYAAHQLYQAWDRIGPAQKSLALATLGVQNFKFADGQTAATKPVPATTNTPYNPVTVGEAVGLLNAGYNTKTMTDSWETVNDIHAIKSGGAGNVMQVAETMQQLGALGHGTNGSATPGISAEQLADRGWKGVPSLGVGAIRGAKNARLPRGYVALSTSKDGVLAVPKASAQTAVVPASGSLAGTLAGQNGSSLSAKSIYNSWKKNPAYKAEKGIIGGSAVLTGIYNMSPEEQAALSVASMFKNIGAA